MSSANTPIDKSSPMWRNMRRIQRMDTWIKLADVADDKHVKFVFYWIAFEAGYIRQSGRWQRPGGADGKRRFLREVSTFGGASLQNIINQFAPTAEKLFALRWASNYFWYDNSKWGDLIKKKCRHVKDKRMNALAQEKAWEEEFQSHVEEMQCNWRNAANKGDYKSTKQALLDIFDVLTVVRHQIVHGGSAGNNSFGKSQVEWGAELLGAFVPLFKEIIEANKSSDWGIPPFPRLPDVVEADQDYPPPWLL